MGKDKRFVDANTRKARVWNTTRGHCHLCGEKLKYAGDWQSRVRGRGPGPRWRVEFSGQSHASARGVQMPRASRRQAMDGTGSTPKV